MAAAPAAGKALAFIKAIFVGAGAKAGAGVVIGSTVARIVLLAAAAKALTPKPRLPSLAVEKSLTVRSTVAPRTIVYGVDLVSGPVVYQTLTSSSTDPFASLNNRLHVLVALTGHPVQDIGNVWFDDEVIGGGNINDELTAASPITYEVTAGTFRGNTNFPSPTRINRQLGDGPQSPLVPDFILNSTSPNEWSSAHIGFGVSYVSVEMTLTTEQSDVYEARGQPGRIAAAVAGKKDIYDPRDDTGGAGDDPTNPAFQSYSTNPALCLADYLRTPENLGGFGDDPDVIDWVLVEAAADICDQTVVIPPAASPQNTQTRYTCNGTLSTADSHRTNVQKLLDCFHGRLVFSQGKWRMWAGAAQAATITIDENDLRSDGAIEVRASASKTERWNRVRGTYVDPTRNFQPVGYIEAQSSTFEIDDDGVLYKDHDLSLVNNEFEAQRNAIIELNKSRNQEVVSFPGKWSVIDVQPGTTVNLTIAELGYASKKFLCTEWAVVDGGGIDLLLVEEDDNVYDDPAIGDYGVRTDEGTVNIPDQGGLPLNLSDGLLGDPNFFFTARDGATGANASTKWWARRQTGVSPQNPPTLESTGVIEQWFMRFDAADQVIDSSGDNDEARFGWAGGVLQLRVTYLTSAGWDSGTSPQTGGAITLRARTSSDTIVIATNVETGAIGGMNLPPTAGVITTVDGFFTLGNTRGRNGYVQLNVPDYSTGNLDVYEIQIWPVADLVDQAIAEAATSNLPVNFSPLRIAQAINPTDAAEAASPLLSPTTWRYELGDPRRYGAVGDGTTDDAAAIQQAIDVTAGGPHQVTISEGVFAIGASLTLRSNVTIRGTGLKSIIRVQGGTGDTVNPMFEGDDVNDIEISDLTLDGNATNLTQSAGHAGIFIDGCSRVRISRVKITDLGRTSGTPAGTHILMAAWEAADDEKTAGHAGDIPVRDNIIEDCVFDDPNNKASFGVRLKTNWLHNIAQSAFTIPVEYNHVRNNSFSGFAFSPIEIAGPMTQHNVIHGNVSRGWSGASTPIEADKGASYNVFSSNQVHDYEGTGSTTFYRVQGEIDSQSPLVGNRIATGNVFVGNIGRNLATAATNSRGMVIDTADETLVEGNTFDCAIDAGNSVGIEIRNHVNNVSIIGNRIFNATTGILNDFDDLGDNSSHWMIRNNDIEATTNGINFANTDAGGFTLRYIQVINNSVRNPSAAGINLSTGTSRCVAIGNLLNNVNDGIRNNGTDNVIHSNVVDDFDADGIRIQGSSATTKVVANVVQNNNTATNSYDNEDSLIDVYVNANIFEDRLGVDDDHGRKRMYSTAAPVSGTWDVGDIMWDRVPNVDGNNMILIGWICTTAGTPGTWSAMYVSNVSPAT